MPISMRVCGWFCYSWGQRTLRSEDCSRDSWVQLVRWRMSLCCSTLLVCCIGWDSAWVPWRWPRTLLSRCCCPWFIDEWGWDGTGVWVVPLVLRPLSRGWGRWVWVVLSWPVLLLVFEWTVVCVCSCLNYFYYFNCYTTTTKKQRERAWRVII